MGEEGNDHKEYLNNLQEASKMYYTSLWVLPAIFLGGEGFILSIFDFTDFISLKNLIAILCNVIFSTILWLQFEKSHGWQLILQGKIEKLEEGMDRIPFYSMHNDKFKEEIAKWELQHKGLHIYSRVRLAVYSHVSDVVAWVMIFSIIFSFSLSLIIFLKLFVK